jgi:hypothetical protein
MRPETIAVHGGYTPDPTTKAVAVPIYQTTSYAFDSAQHGADLFDLKVQGNIYTRIMNPTSDVLEKRIAELEGGIGALALASGSAAVTYAILTIAGSGDNIVSSGALYGGTYNLFAHTLPQFGIEVRFADYSDPAQFERLIDSRTKAVFCESIGNPLGNVTDFAAIAAPSTTVPTSSCTRSPSTSAATATASAACWSTPASSPGPSTRRASRGSTSRTSRITAWCTPRRSGPRRTSGGRASCRCATWARRSRPSTPS